MEQETYPSTPPVWFAESEETSITNAVQILSTTEGQNNHVLNQVSMNVSCLCYPDIIPMAVNVMHSLYFHCRKQVNILLRELCRLHNAPLPSELDTLLLPPNADFYKVSVQQQCDQQPTVEDSDAEEIEDATLESEPESEVDEDLSLEMDDGRNANKVPFKTVHSNVNFNFNLNVIDKRFCEFSER